MATPLFAAVEFNQEEMVAFLIDRKANVNAVDNERNTALHLAAINGFSDIIILLLRGILMATNTEHAIGAITSAIICHAHAIFFSFLDVFDLFALLLLAGSASNVLNDKDETPLDVAKNADICRIILGT
jgi:ankyrin repeat protein